MTTQDRRDAVAVLLLRLSLCWFIFLWASHKLITPTQYQSLAKNFDGLDLSVTQIYLIGAIQIAICALAALGIFRGASYGAIAAMHLYTLTRRWEGFLDPFALNARGFPIHRNQVVDLVVMAACLALLLLIARDHLSVGAVLNRKYGARWWR
ncbi:MAG: hypothetical protein AAF755_08615 [Pseudomonadota bacterium]